MASLTVEQRDYFHSLLGLGIITNQAGFAKKVKSGWKSYLLAQKRGLSPTPYFFEALAYVDRAKILQAASLKGGGIGGKVPKVGDPLMEAIPIYNTVNRRYAGFSNVLEQLWYGSAAPKFKANQARRFAKFGDPQWQDYVKNGRWPGVVEWLYICLAHRITGSGASFEWDHGWRNNHIYRMANMHKPEVHKMACMLANIEGPIFTSIGNQIPPFNKPKLNKDSDEFPDWWTGGREYLFDIAPELVTMMYAALLTWFGETGKPMPIKTCVDMALKFNRALGCKQFKFVLTAWVMDLAEYLPWFVDPKSDVYHGKNAMEAIEVCFEVNMKKQDLYDKATRLFADVSGTRPMDVEDASPGCDLVRWLENYVPKKGFDHVHEQGIFNGSSLVWDKGRQPPPF